MIRTPVAALVLVAVSFVRADPPKADPKTDPKAESKVQKYCPVMTKDEVDLNASKWVDYKGVKVYLCCDTCVARFKQLQVVRARRFALAAYSAGSLAPLRGPSRAYSGR